MAVSILAAILAGGGSGGGVNVVVNATDMDASGSGTQQVSFTFSKDGTSSTAGLLTGSLADWATPAYTDVGAQFEIKLTVNSGDAPTTNPGTGTFLPLSTSKTWAWVTGTTLSANITVEIRRTGGSTISSDTWAVSVQGGLP